MLSHSANPEWEEHFEILVADEVEDISFTVKDDNWIGVSPVTGSLSSGMMHVQSKKAKAALLF